MANFSVRGFTAATTANADHCIAELWNPDSLKRITLFEGGLFKANAGTAGDSIYICRTTAKGTAGSTLTPTASNAWSGDDVPASLATVELSAFSVQPTRQAAPFLWGWVAAAASADWFI